MCSSDVKVATSVEVIMPSISQIYGRPVLQPTCNRVPSLERHNSIKKTPPSNYNKSLPPPISPPTRAKTSLTTPPISPKPKSPRPAATKRASEGLTSSSERILIPKSNSKPPTLDRKKSKSFSARSGDVSVANGLPSPNESSLSYSSSLIVEAPGTIAAGRREQMALQQAQRKMKIAHYGRSKSAKFEANIVPIDTSNAMISKPAEEDKKRCSFITANSDPIYVAYHDQEWGVPVHDDKLLFELLALSGAQVGSDWTSILKKRQDFRSAFADFDAEVVAKFTEKQMMSMCKDYGIDISRVRGVVDNSNRILEVRKEFGSFERYIWTFVNNKPICPQYKVGHKIPVKTSKSETISKDMQRRGFRFVGPTVVHSFMQAAGLTNDHLTTCHKHLHCNALPEHNSSVPQAQ